MIGATLSRYRLLERLGAGAMGEVFRAEDLRLRRSVALKIVRLDGLPAEAHDRLLAEARAASALNHPHIAVVYEVDEGVLDGARVAFIAMEYVDGRVLSDPVTQAALSVDDVLDIGAQVATALADAHGRGIVHRDIKPANVMLSATGQVKVLDFGVAHRLAPPLAPDDTTRTSDPFAGEAGFAGTLAYMAPEQARGQDVDGRADMFSLGVLLYELLAGRRPFDGAGAVTLLDAILRDDPPPLTPRLDDARAAAIEGVVRRMLAKDPAHRFASLADVAQSLQALRRGERLALVAPTTTIVAVAGFTNISGNPDDEWLGTGLAETIAADCSQIDGVTVVPRARVHELLRTLDAQGETRGEAQLRRMARELGARWVVSGGFQRAGPHVRATASVLDAASGQVARTVKADGTIDGIFALQDSLVRELTDVLRPAAAPAGPASDTTAVEAYQAFSKGVVNLQADTYEALDRAVLLFERAVSIDPRYARAHLELGVAYAGKADYLWMPSLRLLALASLQRALDLEPDSVRGWRELGSVLMAMGREPEGLTAIRRALALDADDAGALGSMGRALFIGRAQFREAAVYFDRALARNPHAGWAALQLAHAAAFLRDFERGEAAARRSITLQEALLSGHEGLVIAGGSMRLGHLAALQGRHAEAIDHCLREIDFLTRVDHALRQRILVELNVRMGAAHLQLGQPRKARAALDLALEGFDRRVRLGADDPFTRYYAAAAHALLGDVEAALVCLERAARERPAFTLARARIEPEFDAIRSDDRFARLVARGPAAGA